MTRESMTKIARRNRKRLQRRRLHGELLEDRRLLAAILFEDFEDAAITYTPAPADSLADIGNNDYYGRISFASLPGNVSYANQQGSAFYGAQDMDGALPTPTTSVQLNWTGINIASFTNLDLSWFVAEDDDGTNQDWDSTDSVRLSVQIDGGGFTDVFAIEAEENPPGDQLNNAPRVDTNFDGIGDGVEITNVFTQFNTGISDGNTLDIRLTIDQLNGGDEDIAFDNLLLQGDVANNPPSLLSFQRSVPPSQFTNADSLVFRATFSEDVQNVNAADFNVNGSTATVTGVSAINAAVYDLTVSGGNLNNLNGIVGVDLAPGQNITDLGASPLPAGEPTTDETYTVDNTAPTTTSFTRQLPATSPTDADILVFRATFSESVSNVSPGDFVATGTTAGIAAVVPVSTSVYDVTVSGGDLGTLNGVVGLDLSGGQNIADFAGNALSSSEPGTDETYTMDNVGAPVSLLFEDFEDAVLTYTPTPADSLGDLANNDYYGRVAFANLPGSTTYNNQLGQSFYGAHDIDGATVPATSVVLDWTGINISGFTNLDLSYFFAEDDEGANQDWDDNDSVRLSIQLDGGGYNDIFAIEGSGGLNSTPRVDTDFNGVGDGAEITDTFTQFSNGIADGSTLDIRLTIDVLNAGDEDIGFDNLSLVGEAVDVAPALVSFERNTPPSQFTNADSLVFRATFSEDVQNVDAADFNVNGSTSAVTGVSVVNAAVYDLTVSGGNLANLDGVVGIDLAPGQNITDLVANPLPAGEPVTDETYTVDNTAPTTISFTRQLPAGSPTSEDILVFRATFSEAVSNVSPGDFAANGTTATVSAVVPVSTSVYDVTVSGGDLGVLNGVVGLDLAGGQNIADFAGNALVQAEPATDETYVLDNVGVPISLLFEDFEDAILTYTPTPADSLGGLASNDYYGRVAFANLPGGINYNNQLGQSFYGAQDIDGAAVPATTVVLDWTNIDISNFTNLELSYFFAEDDDGANQDWDDTDSVRLSIQLDGGGYNDIFAIEGSGGTNSTPRVDTNFDGVGDGVEITDTFTQFSNFIPDGTSLDIRLTIETLNALDEDIAFDNLSLVGDLGSEVESIVYFNENAAAEASLTNDNSGQRSIVRQIEVTFTSLVSVPTGPVTDDSFVVESTDAGTLGTKVGLDVVSSQVVGNKQVVVLNFTGTTLIEDTSEGVPPVLPMLEDGNYRLTVDGALLGIDANGLAPGVDAVDDFYRFYGDSDADGDVDLFDFARFRDYFNNGTRSERFDFNDNSIGDLFDFAEFRGRFLTSI